LPAGARAYAFMRIDLLLSLGHPQLPHHHLTSPAGLESGRHLVRRIDGADSR
jgi:hypothetical protein